MENVIRPLSSFILHGCKHGSVHKKVRTVSKSLPEVAHMTISTHQFPGQSAALVGFFGVFRATRAPPRAVSTASHTRPTEETSLRTKEVITDQSSIKRTHTACWPCSPRVDELHNLEPSIAQFRPTECAILPVNPKKQTSGIPLRGENCAVTVCKVQERRLKSTCSRSNIRLPK